MKPIDNQWELQIIRQAQMGNRSAFGELVNLYKDRVSALGYRILSHPQEVEDVTQEAFIRVFIHLKHFDTRRKFSSWIYRITINLCIDRLRKRKGDLYLESSMGMEWEQDWYQRIPGEELTPEERLIEQEWQQELRQAVDTLPEGYRTVIRLRYLYELPLAEIGAILSLPVTTIKSRVHRGRQALRDRLASS